MSETLTTSLTIRALARSDLDAVVAIDAAIEGRSRRAYVERRLAAALREPKLHAQFAACSEDGVVGFKKVKTRRFTGKTTHRTAVVVE